MRILLCLGLLTMSCGRNSPSTLLDASSAASMDQLRDELYSPSDRAKLDAILPSQEPLASLLHHEKILFYDKRSIVPGYQDSMGDPEGMRPNTLRSNLIDQAVPGGHATLFAQKGRFNFPFGTGGIDRSPSVSTVNFWIPTSEPVVTWRARWSRWGWVFPEGTQIGEILMFESENKIKRVFEVRVRTRERQKWSNRVFRPFSSARQLADLIRTIDPSKTQLIEHLENNNRMSIQELSSTKFPSAYEPTRNHVDELPSFESQDFISQLYAAAPWNEIGDQPWKTADDGTIAYGASTQSSSSIVPAHYDGASFPINDDFCARCHQDAGRSIQDFYPVMAAYGELWGEDQTFSWHPFETSMFVGPAGDVNNFNHDNRRIRKSFADTGLVVPYDPQKHPNAQQLHRSWTYRPF